MEMLKKIVKSRITICIFGVMTGAMLSSNTTEENNKINTYDSVVSERDELSARNTELQDKVTKSEKYLSLTDEEKTLVDAKIDEVKQATADEIAKQKAEKQ